MYSREYVGSAVLVSAWGWSIFFASVDAVDPADTSTNLIRLARGVPSRRGLRKARIIDGPSELRMSHTLGETLMKEPQVVFFPGVSTAQKGIVQVGNHSDAFKVTQTFNWKSQGKSDKKHKLGFREMQELCMKADVLHSCKYVDDVQDWEGWITCRIHDHPNNKSPAVRIKYGYPSIATFYEPRWPELSDLRKDAPELVFETSNSRRALKRPGATFTDRRSSRLWYFHVSTNLAAWWLQLDDMNSCSDRVFELFIRGPDTCRKCASFDHTFDNIFGLLLL